MLCEQGEHDETLYVIDSGEAIIHQIDARGLERPIDYLREGGVIGVDALLLGDANDKSVQAKTDVEALAIRKPEFDALLKEHPEIGVQLTIRPLVRERRRARSFPWFNRDEAPLLMRRRHWVVFARAMFLPLFVLLLLGILLLLLLQAGVSANPWFVILLLGIPFASITLWLWADWRNDFYLVTTQRIVHRERLILLYESRDEAPLDKIQGTRISRRLLGKLLKYGNVHVETAATRGSIVLDHLPDPEGMREVIDKQASALNGRLRKQEREEIYQQLLVKTGRAQPTFAQPPAPAPARQLSILARLTPKRPLLRLRYEQADRLVWRKHWIFLLQRIWVPLLAALLISAVWIMGSLSLWPNPFGPSLLLVLLVLWIAVWLWLLWEVEDWRNDEYVVTNEAVIDVQKKPLFFDEVVRRAGLERIENVSIEIHGVLPNLLNYGNVLIQTAGATGAITFENVPHPGDIQAEVFRRIEVYKEGQRRHDRERRKAETAYWFEKYHQIIQGGPPPAAA